MASKWLGVLLLVAITSSAQACNYYVSEYNPLYHLVPYEQFRELSSFADSTQYDYFIKYANTVGKISTKEEAAMALAQIIHDSEYLALRREYGCDESSPCPGRYVSACDVPGQSYYGRGVLQLKWCNNYRDASTAIFGDPEVLLNDPDKVAKEDDLAWHTAFWFWGARVHNKPGVKDGQFGATTKALAPEECGAEHENRGQRERIYRMVRRELGLSGEGDMSGCY